MADDKPKEPIQPFETAGVTGLKRTGGRVFEEWLPELQGERGRRVIRQMVDGDPIVGAAMLAIDLLCRNIEWSVQPASTETADAEAAQFLDECYKDMSSSWHDTISEILSFVPWGWSWTEIVYKVRGGDSDDPKRRSKYDDNRIGWRKISIRAQETLWEWVFDDDGGIKAMVQMAPPDYQVRTIPIEKSLLFRMRARKGNPEPPGILRNVYEPWYYATNLNRVEAIGIEKDATGTMVMWVPPSMMRADASEEEKAAYAAYKRSVTDYHTHEQMGFVMPLKYDKDGNKLYDLTLITSPGTKQIGVDKSIQRHKHAMAMAMLTDFMLLGTKTTGSFALSEDKTTLFTKAINTFLDTIEETFNTHAVPRLFKMNTFPVKVYPQLKHGRIEAVDVEKMTKAVMNLAMGGMPMFPDPELENYLRGQMQWPLINEAEVKRRQQEPLPDKTNTEDQL